METISKHIGEGFGKGELYAALAYDSSDAFGGMAIKQVRFNPAASTTAIIIGDSTTAITLAAAAQRAISIVTTCALTTGSIKSMEIAQTHTGANTASNIEVLKVQLTSDVKTGAWVNAIFGRINYTANGYAYGSGSAICGELSMPAGGPGQGTYSVFQAEIDIPTGATAIGHETSVFDINIWGGKKDLFDDHGYFFTITGIASATTHFWFENTLKCKVLGTDWYLPLSSAEAEYKVTKTLSAEADRVINIITTSALATGSIKSVEIAQTHTGASTAHNIEVFKAQLTSDVKTGAWVNAIFGRVNYTVNGWAYGSASAVCGEVSLAPGGSHSGQGTYAVFQAELDVPASAVGIGSECSFFRASVWGNQSGLFDDSGFVFVLTGIASGSAHLWYDKGSAITPGDASEWLRVKTPGGTRYLMLYDSPS